MIVNVMMMILNHFSWNLFKESHAKNKELKVKKIALLREISKLFQENKKSKKKIVIFKNRLEFDFIRDYFKRMLDEKTKFYEKIKMEQILLKQNVNDLCKFLQNEKQKLFAKKRVSNTFLNKNYTIFERNGTCLVKSIFVRNPSVTCHYCCQHDHMLKEILS